MTTETKAGLVTLLGIAALVVSLIFLRGGITIREGGYDLRMRVANAQGVKRGKPVQMAGIVVGQVKRLGLTPDRRAEITLRIREDVAIPTGSRFATATEGVLGDRFITISPGPPDAPPIPPDSVVVGADPFTLDQLFDRIAAVARRAEETLASINRLVSDPDLGPAIGETVRNARDATAVMRRAAENVERMTRALDRTVASDVPAIARELRSMASELAGAAREVRTLVRDVEADGETSRQIRETIGSVQRAAQRIEKMTEALSGVINEQQVRSIRASISEAQSAITEARQGVTEVRQGVAEARAVVGRATQVVDRVNRIIPERLDLPGLRGSYRLDYELWYAGTRAGHDVRFTLLPDAPRRYIFTWRDIGVGNRIGLQIGDRLQGGPMTFRYGLIDGQVGLGLDYGVAPAPVYSLDLYNINQITVNIYASYLLRGEYGITLRGQNLLNSPTFGIGVFRRF